MSRISLRDVCVIARASGILRQSCTNPRLKNRSYKKNVFPINCLILLQHTKFDSTHCFGDVCVVVVGSMVLQWFTRETSVTNRESLVLQQCHQALAQLASLLHIFGIPFKLTGSRSSKRVCCFFNRAKRST